MSAALLSASPKNSSSVDLTWTLSSRVVISQTTTTSRIGKSAIVFSPRRRPSRIPTPMPRKLAISRKLREEADVADLGGNPADEQQLDEQQRAAGEDEAGSVAAQAIEDAGRRDRSRLGAG